MSRIESLTTTPARDTNPRIDWEERGAPMSTLPQTTPTNANGIASITTSGATYERNCRLRSMKMPKSPSTIPRAIEPRVCADSSASPPIAKRTSGYASWSSGAFSSVNRRMRSAALLRWRSRLPTTVAVRTPSTREIFAKLRCGQGVSSGERGSRRRRGRR